MFLEFKQVLRMYQNSPGTKYYFQNVYGSPQAEIFLMTYQLKTKLNWRYEQSKRCPEGAKKNHEACLCSPDCKFWIGPEGLFRTCQLCLRSCSVHIFGHRWRNNRSFTKWQNVLWIQTSTVSLILNGKYLKTAISWPICKKYIFWDSFLFSNF